MTDKKTRESFAQDSLYAIMAETEKLAKVGGWEWDIIEDIWTFTDNWLRIHGCSNRHLKTADLIEIAHPDDKADIQKAFEKAVTEGTTYEIEHRIIHQTTGEERYIRAHGKTRLDDNGKTIKLFGSAQDITAQKVTEDSLRQNEKRLKIATDSGGIGLWELNLIDHTAWRSLKHDQIFGYETLLPDWTYDIFLEHVLEEDRPLVESKFGTALTDRKTWDFQCRIRRKDGDIRWIHAKGKAEFDLHQTPLKMYGTVQDITELKHSEAQLSKQHAMLLRTEAISNVGSWEWDIETDTVTWSDELFRIFLLTPGSETPNWTEHQKLYHPKDFQKLQKAVELAITDGKSYELELRALRKNGEIRICRALGLPERGIDGKVARLYGLLQDITDQKKAERKLVKNEALLKELEKTAQIGGWELNPATNTATWTEEVSRIYEIEETPSVEKMISYFAPEAQPIIQHAFDNLMKTGEPYDLELPFITETGRHLWVRTMGKAIYHHNKIKKLSGNIQDITRRKKAETALQQNYYLLERITDNMFDLVSLTDIEGNFNYAGKSHERILGYAPDELIGKNALAFVHPDDVSQIREKLENLFKTGEIQTGRFRYKHKKGHYLWLETIGELLQDEHNAPDQIIFSTRDITEQRKAEEILKENERRYKSAQRIGKVGNWEYDLVNEIFWGSDQAKRIYGLDPDKDKFTTEEIENCIPDRERVHQALINLIENDVTYDLEFDIHPVSGPKYRTIRSLAEVLKDDTGRPLKVTGVIQDITEQKKAAQERALLESRLLQAQKMESIGTLAGGIAHDFNNILSSILGFTELALENAGKEGLLREDLQEVYTAGLRAKDLVRQILTFARQAEEEIRPIQANYIIEEVLKLIRSSTPASIDIKQFLESNSYMMGNAIQLHQIMMNLCSNSAHAMEDKGGTLEITLKDTVLDRDYGKEPGKDQKYLEIKVSDTGVGIKQHLIKRIFEPYFTTKKFGEGTGMGLAVVHGITESFGGEIRVESEEGKGTVVTLYFPICTSSKDNKPEFPDDLPTGQERILFVDDEIKISKIGTRILEQLGYSVTSVNSSIEAFELFQENPNDFDLVISDVTMPGMKGNDLAIRLMQIRPDIPIVLSTGYTKHFSEKEALKIGVKAFTTKPIVKAELAKTVREVLDEAKTNNQG